MKLRNKKTGDILHTDGLILPEPSQTNYHSLAELNEEWEDYEEPVDFWFIDNCVGIRCDSKDPSLRDEKYDIETMEAIGNYFESREEAEQAVEKLKAWKRLVDNGFKFVAFYNDDEYCKYKPAEDYPNMHEDLALLFGGED